MSAMVVVVMMMMAMMMMVVMVVMEVGRMVRGREQTALEVSGEVGVGGGRGQGRPAGTTLMRTSMR